jgi:hypothetical protein
MCSQIDNQQGGRSLAQCFSPPMNPGETGEEYTEVSRRYPGKRAAIALATKPAKPRLCVGEHVRVHFGVLDRDYPDVSIEGWAGTIMRTDDDRATPCLVRWDWNTLERAHSTRQGRRNQDGVASEEMWLAEDDLLVDPSSDY